MKFDDFKSFKIPSLESKKGEDHAELKIKQLLSDKYGLAKQWVLFFELRIGTGFGKDNEQRIDAYAMNLWPSQQLLRVAYEIKISRDDFLRELRKPKKRRAAMRLSNQFYFIAPRGIISAEEVPYDCGLVEVTEEGTLVTTVEAPSRDSIPATWSFVAAICRRITCATIEG